MVRQNGRVRVASLADELRLVASSRGGIELALAEEGELKRQEAIAPSSGEVIPDRVRRRRKGLDRAMQAVVGYSGTELDGAGTALEEELNQAPSPAEEARRRKLALLHDVRRS